LQRRACWQPQSRHSSMVALRRSRSVMRWSMPVSWSRAVDFKLTRSTTVAGMDSPAVSPSSLPDRAVRAALRSPSFATLLAGYAVSAVGDGMAGVAISWLAIVLAHGHDTGLLVGVSIAAYTLPGVAAGLGLGRLLTLWDPRLLILAEAALRAVSLGLVAAGAVAGVLTPVGYVAAAVLIIRRLRQMYPPARARA